jgi:NTP pyrophosphatase (non-canonical NTP hydrolase)
MLNETDLEAWEYYNETYKNKDMSLNEYQNAAAKTAVYKTAHQILYPALGLAGEAGEVANKVKKMLRDNDFDRDAIVAEIGDVLYCCLV